MATQFIDLPILAECDVVMTFTGARDDIWAPEGIFIGGRNHLA